MATIQAVDITKVFPKELLTEFASTLGIRPPDVGAAQAQAAGGYKLSDLQLQQLGAAFTKGVGSATRFAASASAAAGRSQGMERVGAFLQQIAQKNPTLAARALKHVVEVAEANAKVGPGGQYV